jgi:hypothetical protein
LPTPTNRVTGDAVVTGTVAGAVRGVVGWLVGGNVVMTVVVGAADVDVDAALVVTGRVVVARAMVVPGVALVRGADLPHPSSTTSKADTTTIT